MQPKVELMQIRNLSEIVDDSILFFKQNWKPLLKTYFFICAFFWIAGLIISVFNQTETFRLQEEGESIFSITYFLTLFWGLLSYTVLTITALSFIVLYHEKGNETPSVDEVWAYVKYYFFRVFGTSILLTALLAAGFVCCVLPGIYFIPVYMIIITIMILENASLGYSFGQGFRLIASNWWHTFGVMVVMSVIVLAATLLLLIPSAIVTGIILAFTKVNTQHTILIAAVFTLNALQFLYVLPIIAFALIYYNLTLRKDDSSIYQRINTFGEHSQSNDNLPTEEY